MDRKRKLFVTSSLLGVAGMNTGCCAKPPSEIPLLMVILHSHHEPFPPSALSAGVLLLVVVAVILVGLVAALFAWRGPQEQFPQFVPQGEWACREREFAASVRRWRTEAMAKTPRTAK